MKSRTASGNREKERKTAELMQKHAADCFATDMELAPFLQENAEKQMEKLSDAMLDLLYERIFELLYRLAESRKMRRLTESSTMRRISCICKAFAACAMRIYGL